MTPATPTNVPTTQPEHRPQTDPQHVPGIREQAEHLIALGIPALAGIDPAQVRAMADDDARAGSAPPGATQPGTASPGGPSAHPPTPLLVLPGAPIAELARLLRHGDKSGFVVPDMTDVDEFLPAPGIDVPAGPYLVHGLDRGDHFRNASPEEAQAQFATDGRTPLTLTEGIMWALARPQVLEPNRCFMTIASRLGKPGGRFDARTPALWISGGTGRDGVERRNAPKVGWCWWRNRHTWLGIASAAGRTPLPCVSPRDIH